MLIVLKGYEHILECRSMGLIYEPKTIFINRHLWIICYACFTLSDIFTHITAKNNIQSICVACDVINTF